MSKKRKKQRKAAYGPWISWRDRSRNTRDIDKNAKQFVRSLELDKRDHLGIDPERKPRAQRWLKSFIRGIPDDYEDPTWALRLLKERILYWRKNMTERILFPWRYEKLFGGDWELKDRYKK